MAIGPTNGVMKKIFNLHHGKMPAGKGPSQPVKDKNKGIFSKAMSKHHKGM